MMKLIFPIWYCGYLLLFIDMRKAHDRPFWHGIFIDLTVAACWPIIAAFYAVNILSPVLRNVSDEIFNLIHRKKKAA